MSAHFIVQISSLVVGIVGLLLLTNNRGILNEMKERMKTMVASLAQLDTEVAQLLTDDTALATGLTSLATAVTANSAAIAALKAAIGSGSPDVTAELNNVTTADQNVQAAVAALASAVSSINSADLSAPAITSPLTASGNVGAAFSYQIVATNTPTSFAASNLPAGLTVDPVAGLISGTPTAAGVSVIGLAATNAAGTGSANLTLTVS